MGAVVTCDASGNPYPHGIQYSTTGSQTVNLGSGVVVDVPGRIPFVLDPAPGLSVSSAGTGTVTVNGGQSVSITSGVDQAVSLVANVGDITANLDTLIAQNSASNDQASGIAASVRTRGDITLNIGHVTTYGSDALAITTGTQVGAIDITVGSIVTNGADYSSPGVYAGGTNITVRANSIVTSGDFSAGIAAYGQKTVTIYAGQVTTLGITQAASPLSPAA